MSATINYICEVHEIVIIGAGQAGLATSYHLQIAGIPHVVLDAHTRVGDNWRKRWDSLSLFSPAQYNSLPGLPFPLPSNALPTRLQAADYLEQYAAHFKLPIQPQSRVTGITKGEKGFELQIIGPENEAHALTCQQVIVATGPYRNPRIPAFAENIPSQIEQKHTSEYKNPNEITQGPVMVVGAGASGSQIAAELASVHKVVLVGRNPGHFPRKILGKDIYWWFYKTGLIRMRKKSLGGRYFLRKGRRGDALVGRSLKSLVKENGVEYYPGKVTGYKDGAFELCDGKQLRDIRAVVWATGYRTDYSWLDVPGIEAGGQLQHERGVVVASPGLYFVGLWFQYDLSSATMGGVGADAKYIADQVIAARTQLST